MTAINVIKHRDSVHMITDGASWEQNKGFLAAVCKSITFPHFNAVVAARGPRLGLTVAQMLNGAGRSYDEMKRNAVEALRAAWLVYLPVLRASAFGDELQIVVAGLSESVGPDAFVVATGDHDPALRPWQAIDAGPVLMTPCNEAIESLVRAGLPAGVESADEMDPARDGLLIIEAQRSHNRITGAQVGAFAHLTSVYADRIESKILDRWQDEWGRIE